MNEQSSNPRSRTQSDFAGEIGSKAVRKIKARREAQNHVWFGLGMMGLIGWSVVVPTLAGTGLGLWLDKNFPSEHHWTLALLVAGLCLGCLNAWAWVSKESKALHDQQEEKDD
ncbi:AtpZ/AtpI family protein [Luteolibacter pohnpeiensis]|uniref:AtpZ/AtpI family protein n=1 Tax=Luteolibacter pohnpeiensis TaxID=454153 RepID=A0A934S829_9BACT|nr:AtpZ/AtpI family protein [Luteolibacter pohnpeiensis]MBK1883035.1 AtpZ/AtpI family protein [Luteolibacter pohnpeiensis]